MRLRKNMKRTAAAVLALSMAVSAVAAPASAGYTIDMSDKRITGDVEIKQEADSDGKATITISVGGTVMTEQFKNDDTDDDIIITGDNTKPAAAESLNAEEENTSEAEKSGENAGETEGEGKTQNSAAEGEDEGDEPTSQELLAPEDEKKTEQKPAETQETEQTQKPTDTVLLCGQNDPEADKEATKPATKPVVKQETEKKKAAEEKTYEDTNAPTSLSESVQAAARNVVSIINNSASVLNVILRNLKVDAGETDKNAVTIEGSGNVTLELDGKNELTGGTGLMSCYDAVDRTGAGLRAAGDGTTTIKDSEGSKGSLIATGGSLTVSKAMEKSDYAMAGSGIDGAEIAGGTVIGKGGDIISKVSDSNYKQFGAGSGIVTKKISGGIVEATGGDVTGEGVTGEHSNSLVWAGNGLGGDGHGNSYSGPIEISGGTVKATGGNVSIERGDYVKNNFEGAAGVVNRVKVSGGRLIARGGDGKAYGGGGPGIKEATISGGSVTAIGGDGITGGNGIDGGNGTNSSTTVNGGTVTAQGGEGTKTNGVAVRQNAHLTVSGTAKVTQKEPTHKHEYAYDSALQEATCAVEGYKLKKCSCGAEELEHIAKKAHNWVENGHRDATCVKDGYIEYECSVCGATKRDEIPATGEHHFTVVAEVVAPTYTSEGYTIYKCTDCNETEKREIVPMLVPESNGGSSGGSSAVTLTVTPAVAYETSIADGRYIIAVPAETATLSGCLGNLRELKERDVTTIVFRTQLRETALDIDRMLSLGVDDTLFALTHSGESAELTVDGFAHNEQLH